MNRLTDALDEGPPASDGWLDLRVLPETYIAAKALDDDMDDMIPLKVPFEGESAAGLKSYIRGIGKWHRNNPRRSIR